ncbi:MAG: zinc ribbon domain-containing protein, partial [Christensenellales bacterium]
MKQQTDRGVAVRFLVTGIYILLKRETFYFSKRRRTAHAVRHFNREDRPKYTKTAIYYIEVKAHRRPHVKCSHCGKSIQDDAVFCAYCGKEQR